MVHLLCGKPRCKNLADFARLANIFDALLAANTQDKECAQCREERATKALVSVSESDARLDEPDFDSCPAIFENNDLKHDVRKVRAGRFARNRKDSIIYFTAKDTVTASALSNQPELVTKKMSWLQKHDRQTVDLFGFLPLIKGMPVALTDHLDKSKDKILLRGRVGWIHSWIVHDKEK